MNSSWASYIVSAEWLARHLGNPSLVILDARDKSSYKNGHIRGAVNLAMTSTFDPDRADGRLATAKTITRLFSEVGIDLDTEVVVYDDGEFLHAARIAWALNVYGNNQARMLDVSFPYWQSMDLPVSTNARQPITKSFQPGIQTDRIASKLHAQLASTDDEIALIDVRTPDEYAGRVSQSRRFGHIPGAINIPRDAMIQHDKNGARIKPVDELKNLFAEVLKKSEIVAYCQKGGEAALAYVVLRELGHRKTSVYDGSWEEWGNTDNLPITNPAITVN